MVAEGEANSNVARASPMEGFEYQGRDLDLDSVFIKEPVQKVEHWGDVLLATSTDKQTRGYQWI